jgi:hypothetical protein
MPGGRGGLLELSRAGCPCGRVPKARAAPGLAGNAPGGRVGVEELSRVGCPCGRGGLLELSRWRSPLHFLPQKSPTTPAGKQADRIIIRPLQCRLHPFWLRLERLLGTPGGRGRWVGVVEVRSQESGWWRLPGGNIADRGSWDVS